MTQFFQQLLWQNSGDPTNAVYGVNVDFNLDPTAQFTLRGSSPLSSRSVGFDANIYPKGVVIDNGANSAVVTLSCALFTVNINQFERQVIAIPAGLSFISFFCSSPIKIPITFFQATSPVPAQTNIFLAAQEATANAVQQFAETFGGGLNPLINSGFTEFPDGVNFGLIPSGAYCGEGWVANPGTVAPFDGNSGQQNLAGLGFSARFGYLVKRTAGSVDLTPLRVGQALTTTDSEYFQGNTATFAIDVLFGGTFSAAVMQLRIIGGTGVDQPYNGFAGTTILATQNVPVQAGVNRVFVILPTTLLAAFTQIAVDFGFVPVGIAGATDQIIVARPQLDIGGTALAYRPTPLPTEKQRCRDFFERLNAEAVALYGFGAGFYNFGGPPAQGYVNFRYQKKRIIPVISFNNLGDLQLNDVIAATNNAVTVATKVSVGLDAAFYSMSQAAAAIIGRPLESYALTGSFSADINSRM